MLGVSLSIVIPRPSQGPGLKAKFRHLNIGVCVKVQSILHTCIYIYIIHVFVYSYENARVFIIPLYIPLSLNVLVHTLFNPIYYLRVHGS